jgi:hypothetical protein
MSRQSPTYMCWAPAGDWRWGHIILAANVDTIPFPPPRRLTSWWMGGRVNMNGCFTPALPPRVSLSPVALSIKKRLQYSHKDLGQLKDELNGKFIKKAYFLGIKKYGYIDSDNDIHSIFSGKKNKIRKKRYFLFLSELFLFLLKE